MPQVVHVTSKWTQGDLGLALSSAMGLQRAGAKLTQATGHLTNNLTLEDIGPSPEFAQYCLQLAVISSLIKAIFIT